MTTNHSSLYYGVRSLVRFTFWGTLGVFTAIGVGYVADVVNPDDDNPCPIALGKNFTWENDGQMFVDVTKCDAPANVTLYQNGTWGWTE